MTVSVNEEQLIGTFIPDVYIETITLETAGTEIRENNPHIDHVRESIKSNQPAITNDVFVEISVYSDTTLLNKGDYMLYIQEN